MNTASVVRMKSWVHEIQNVDESAALDCVCQLHSKRTFGFYLNHFLLSSKILTDQINDFLKQIWHEYLSDNEKKWRVKMYDTSHERFTHSQLEIYFPGGQFSQRWFPSYGGNFFMYHHFPYPHGSTD